MFDRGAYQRMAEQLAAIDGAFILSINDTVETRQMFNQFNLDEARVTYTVNRDKATDAAELIVSNIERRSDLFG